ncbi:Aste57867_13757 [Aphanomyces stellatus]|uniref:Aste57867_13757 protein n=1 Tax=Aphanomyces stellatus TaxID=120398 RepID=A0A485L140_9STRA|nr:hypothetical protein As57867_013707 [Aphanomyces stellatus]VFT90590.1 Aste57867_13757 [Aphanomyces stellatus]
MDPGANGAYAVHASSDMASPPKASKPRKKHDDDAEAHHVHGSRKRARREKESDSHHAPPKIVDDRDRASIGIDRVDHGAPNGNAGNTPTLPPGAVLFLTPAGREEIMGGKTLFELIRRTSRQKSKRREDHRTEDITFAVHDTIMVPQGLVDKIDSKFKDDFVGKIVVEHTKNWIKMSSFGNSREFIQNLTQVVQPRYPCNYPTILDEVLVAFIFKRPEYAEALIKPLIQRLTYNDEPVTAEKHPLIKAMCRKIGKHARGGAHAALASTRHRIATLAIVKTLLEGNTGRHLLNGWILECLRQCPDDLLHVIVAKLTNCITYLSLLQPEPHNLQWLRAWQSEHWDVADAGRQLEELIRLETTPGGTVHKAVVREALLRFGHNPQGVFGLFGEALRGYFAHATPFESFPMLDASASLFPPPYPNDASYRPPVSAMIDLFKKTIPRTTAADHRWFHTHLWPYLLHHWDLPTVRQVFREHMPLVLGQPPASDSDMASPVDTWHGLLAFLQALSRVQLAMASQVLDVWTVEWTASSFELPFDYIMAMHCVALALRQTTASSSSAMKVIVARLVVLGDALGRTFFAAAAAQDPPNLKVFSWYLQCLLKSHGGLAPDHVATLCANVLVHVPEKPGTSWQLLVQRLLATVLVEDAASSVAPATTPSRPTFFDWHTGAVVSFPTDGDAAPASMPSSPAPPCVFVLDVVAALIEWQDTDRRVAALVRQQILAPTCFQLVLQLAESPRRDVALRALALLLHLVPLDSSDSSSAAWAEDHVLHALVALVARRQAQVSTAALAVLNRLATRLPRAILGPLLQHIVEAALDIASVVQLTDVVRRSLLAPDGDKTSAAVVSKHVVAFVTRHLLVEHPDNAWQDASPQHTALLLLRHLCRAETWRDQGNSMVQLVRHGIRTLDTSAEVLCVIQLDILLHIVSRDDTRPLFQEEFERMAVRMQIERLLEQPPRRVPAILAMVRQTLQCLEAFMSSENTAPSQI